MLRRTIETHGTFMLPFLRDGIDVLDCGCGPGSITRSLARRFSAARVTGVDFAESQLDRARELASAENLQNIAWHAASAYALPFTDVSFDVVFSHALLEHLAEPRRALEEFRRVLRPGGRVGLCSPDWGGFLFAPATGGIDRAMTTYRELQCANGGDVFVGRKLGALLGETGFTEVKLDARYEVYPSAELIAEYLATQLDRANHASAAQTFRDWSRKPAAMFAQAWVSAVGVKASG